MGLAPAGVPNFNYYLPCHELVKQPKVAGPESQSHERGGGINLERGLHPPAGK